MLGHLVIGELRRAQGLRDTVHIKLGAGMRALTVSVSVLLASAGVAFGQGGGQSLDIDLSGNWAAVNSQDANMDQPGSEPQLGDFMGVPVNDEARANEESFNPDSMGEPERECAPYPPTYLMIGPFGLRIYNKFEELNGSTVAWVIGGWEDLAPITIWTDGRAQPSKNAAHELSGFTTGKWHNDILETYTTHMRAGILRRNGTPHSDQATMTLWLLRHGTELTVFSLMEDPNYLTQPYPMTRDFHYYNGGAFQGTGGPCVITNEGAPPGVHPYFLPGHNPFLSPDITTKVYGIPVDAVRGGAKTMYPQFRKTIKDHYVRPATCPSAQVASNPDRACGGVGKYPPRVG